MDPDPRTIDRVDVESPTPEPADCLPPGESIEECVRLRSGWVAVTDRQVVTYRSDREPPLEAVNRQNVVGLSLRRAGSGPVIQYAPRVGAYGLLSVVVGLLFRWLAPSASVQVPESAPVGDVLGFVGLFTTGLRLFGLLAMVIGVIALIGAVAALGYRLTAGGTVLAVERSATDPIRCSTQGGSAHRALEQLAAALGEEAVASERLSDRSQASTSDEAGDDD